MKRRILKGGVCLIVCVLAFTTSGYANDRGYFSGILHNYARGIKNVVSSPAEVVIGVKNAQANEGHVVTKWSSGLADGGMRTFKRAWSGIFDFFTAFLPSQQNSMVMNPEVLF